jgi:AraC-like DNA-binding protein
VEIADLLNYAEATNFHRAFQRWNSNTPADYRQQASP